MFILETLKNSPYTKVKARLTDSSLLFIREYCDEKQRLYSYHWQSQDGKMIMRWDNAPHHKNVPTHTHHKHFQNKVLPSYTLTCEEILREIESMIKETRDENCEG